LRHLDSFVAVFYYYLFLVAIPYYIAALAELEDLRIARSTGINDVPTEALFKCGALRQKRFFGRPSPGQLGTLAVMGAGTKRHKILSPLERT
jgi:hypothetical protein